MGVDVYEEVEMRGQYRFYEEVIMRVNRLFAAFISVTLLSLALTACDRDKKPGKKIDNEKVQENADAENIKEQPDAYEGTDSTKDDNADVNDPDDRDRAIKKQNAKARRAYEDFFADDELAVSDVDVKGLFRKGNRYSFSDMIDTYIKNESEYLEPDEKVKLKDATYAYIDCGADGSVELAVDLNYTLYGDYNYVLFFKYDDGEVHLIGTDDWGYRSFLTVNEYGYVNIGGSGGANLYLNEYYYFDENSERIYLYSEETLMGMDSPRVQKFYLKGGYDRDDYPDDSFEADGYTVTTVNFREYEYDEDTTGDALYEKYYKDQIYCFEDSNEKSVKPDSYMIDLYEKEGVKWYSRSELDEIIRKHQDELGADERIREGKEAQWESIVELGVMKHPVDGKDEESTEVTQSYTTYVIKDDHPKPYLNPDNPYTDHEYSPITLKQIKCTENEITDTDEWFKRAGTSASGTDFSDDSYRYVLTGDAGYGTMTHVEVYNKSDNIQLYDFDFSDFLYEKGYEGRDYIDRGIRNCFITDSLLYLNISHRTYAEDCPINAFMICVDINSGEVMWISEPLVSNSDDFARYGDNMITGYGFTAEDDFIYILNRYTGKISEKIKVKKSPDHFAFVNHDLWVRTYSYDYEFSIVE